MKKPFCLLLLVLFSVCLLSPVLFSDYDDGYITEGEYEYVVDWNSKEPPLIVEGGGGYWFEIRGEGRLEVRYTSTPLQWNVGGILDVLLDDDSELLYLGGLTDEVLIYDDANATLKGGLINHIASRQFVDDKKHIDLYCREGWSWLYDSPGVIGGITGQWWDGTAFNIDFIYDADYDPAWQNINIVIPEPATLTLLAAGAFFVKRRR